MCRGDQRRAVLAVLDRRVNFVPGVLIALRNNLLPVYNRRRIDLEEDRPAVPICFRLSRNFPSDLLSPPARALTMSLAVSSRILIFSNGFLSGITSTFVTVTFLAAGAGAGAPHEKGSFLEELVAGAGAPHENGSDPDFVPDAGAGVNENGSLDEDGAGADQLVLELLLLKKSFVLLVPVFPEEANGSLVPPHADLFGADEPKGSLLFVVVLVPNGSLVFPLANGSLVLVEPNGF